MTVDITWEYPSEPDEALIARMRLAGERLLKAAGFTDRSLSLLLVEDRQMRRLNRDWRRVDETTDVLSFPLDEGEGLAGVGPLGDVVISLDVARSQAEEHGLTWAQETLFLLTHAFCHLCGYDHHEPEEAQRMAVEERRLLAIIAPDIVRPTRYYPAT